MRTAVRVVLGAVEMLTLTVVLESGMLTASV